MSRTYVIDEEISYKKMRKPSLLHEVLTDYTWGKYKVQQGNEIEMNEPQHMLFMKHPSIRHKTLIITIPPF